MAKEVKNKKVVKMDTITQMSDAPQEAQGIMEQALVQEPLFLEPSQLKKLQEFQVTMNDAKSTVGDLTINYELQKAEVLAIVNSFRTKMIELEKEISDKYGKGITIDISTGAVTQPAVAQQ